MTLIDSCDSILMLYSYSGFPERSFFIFAKSEGDSETIKEHTNTSTIPVPNSETVSDGKRGNAENDIQLEDRKDDEKNGLPEEPLEPVQSMALQGHASDSAMARDIRVKMNVMSGLSIILTFMSILVAFRYDLFTCLADDHADDPDQHLTHHYYKPYRPGMRFMCQGG